MGGGNHFKVIFVVSVCVCPCWCSGILVLKYLLRQSTSCSWCNVNCMYHIHLKTLIKDVGVFVCEQFVQLCTPETVKPGTSPPKLCKRPAGEGKGGWEAVSRVCCAGAGSSIRVTAPKGKGAGATSVVKVTELVHLPCPQRSHKPFPLSPGP